MFDEFKNAFQRHNNAHIQLILINVVIFIAMGVLFVVTKFSQTQPIFQVVYDQFTLPSELGVLIQRPWTLISYSFAHSFHFASNPLERDEIGVFHILFNMLGFYWFARVFVEYLGSDKLIAVYILGGLSGGILYLLLYNTIPFFANHSGTLVGASASVFAVMTAVAVLLPDYTFYLLFIGPVKAKYIAGFYILMSFLFSAVSNYGGNIAHLGGALMGFVYIKQLQSGINWGRWITATLDWFKNLFTAKPKVKITYRNKENASSKKSSSKSSVSQDEIDIILDKISDGGYESLTKDEKEKLFNASKK